MAASLHPLRPSQKSDNVSSNPHICARCKMNERDTSDMPTLTEKIHRAVWAFTDPREYPSLLSQVGVGLGAAGVLGVFSWVSTMCKKPPLRLKAVALLSLGAIIATNILKNKPVISHEARHEAEVKKMQDTIAIQCRVATEIAGLTDSVLRSQGVDPKTVATNIKVKMVLDFRNEEIALLKKEIALLKNKIIPPQAPAPAGASGSAPPPPTSGAPNHA